MISMLRARKSAADEADRTRIVCIVAAGLAPATADVFTARRRTARQHTGSAGGKV